jgi:3-phosphoshikimate 1-carboxyvinyltransferase
MKEATVRPIHTAEAVDAQVFLPPSKSYTNRALIAAALAEGSSTLVRPSLSDDTEHLIAALNKFGVETRRSEGVLDISGTAGSLRTPSEEIFVGNAGTAMRFLATFAGLAPGATTLTGDGQMRKRPLGDLLAALRALGIRNTSNEGFPPVTINGGTFEGGRVELNGNVSSQFLSSLLLSAPYARHPVTIVVRGTLVSRPYVDMTLHVMRSFGSNVEHADAAAYTVSNKNRYRGQTFPVEGDASSATYFLAAAAITGGRIVVANLPHDSLQGDLRFLGILEEMGCTLGRHPAAVELRGGTLAGIDVDMNALPDCVPTLAVLAAFAEGPTTMRNIAQLRYKETDRLSALAGELAKIGAGVELFEDRLTVHPRPLRGASVATYNDHRLAIRPAFQNHFPISGKNSPNWKVDVNYGR